MRTWLVVAALSPLLACGPGPDESPAGSCSPLITALGYADECRAELCLPTQEIEAVAGSEDDPALTCSSCPESGILQLYRYEDEQLDLSLQFGSEIRGSYSSENFSSAYVRGTIHLHLDIGQGENTNNTIYMPDEVVFEYVDGRLRFELEVPAGETISHSIDSADPDCSIDDQAGSCMCDYELSEPLVLRFDLAIEPNP